MIKRVAKYFLMFSFFLGLQIVVAPLLVIDDVQPDFLLIGVIVAALRHGVIAAIFTGFWTGLAQDAVVSHLFGLEALSKSIAGFVAGYAAKNKNKFDLQLTLGIALVTALANHLVRDTMVILRTVWSDLFKQSSRG